MEEFFNPITTNNRKHDIELQLNHFSVQKDSWKFCVYFIGHTSNQYVSMYALSTIEVNFLPVVFCCVTQFTMRCDNLSLLTCGVLFVQSVINTQWNSLDWESRTQLKNTLYRYFTEQECTVPHFMRNKLAKLIADIARIDWPHFYPDFFTNILEVCT